ncbi:TPA: hypothetical protein ACH1J3_004837, partial [Citrobacter werkmanii]
MTLSVNGTTSTSTSSSILYGCSKKEMLVAIFKELAEETSKIRDEQLMSANAQEVSSFNRQLSSFQHQRESASKTKKASIIAGAGEVLGGIVSVGGGLLGHTASKGFGKARTTRNNILKAGENLKGDALSDYLKINEKTLNPHSHLALLGQCAEPIGKLVSQPASIASSIVGAGAKKLDSVAELDKYNSNLALNNAKQSVEAGKRTSSLFASATSVLASFSQNMTRALS